MNCMYLVIKLMKFEDALDDLREVIERDPRNVKAHYRKGMCYKTISMYCLVSILYLIDVMLKFCL